MSLEALQKAHQLLMILFHRGGLTVSFGGGMTLSNAKWSCTPHSSPACAKGVDKGPYQTLLQNPGGFHPLVPL